MAEKGLSLAPGDYISLDSLGKVFRRLGEQDRALKTFRKAFEKAPEKTAAMYNPATSLRLFGRSDEAEALFERILERDPDDYQALHSRSVLGRQSESHNHISELQGRPADDPPRPAVSHIAYALGKELDDLGRYSEAFEAYLHGAEILCERVPDDLDASLADLEAAVAALASSSAPAGGQGSAVFEWRLGNRVFDDQLDVGGRFRTVIGNGHRERLHVRGHIGRLVAGNIDHQVDDSGTALFGCRNACQKGDRSDDGRLDQEYCYTHGTLSCCDFMLRRRLQNESADASV